MLLEPAAAVAATAATLDADTASTQAETPVPAEPAADVEEIPAPVEPAPVEPAPVEPAPEPMPPTVSEQLRQDVRSVLQQARRGALETVDLSYKGIDDDLLRELCLALRHAPHVTSLNLRNNKFTDAGVIELAEAVSHPDSNVTELTIRNNNITDVGAARIADALKFSPLLVLHLGNCKLTDEGASALGRALPGTALMQLFLSVNHIQELGACVLAESLLADTKLETLGLHCNTIGDIGAKAFADVLASNKTVQYLSFGDCGITDSGAFALAMGVRDNAKNRGVLNYIDFNDNPMTERGEEALASACYIIGQEVGEWTPAAAARKLQGLIDNDRKEQEAYAAAQNVRMRHTTADHDQWPHHLTFAHPRRLYSTTRR